MNSADIEFLFLIYILGVVGFTFYTLNRGINYGAFKNCTLVDYIFIILCICLWPCILVVYLVDSIPKHPK